MKITLTPPIRTAFERASIEGVYRNRLLDLFDNSVQKAKDAHDEWHRAHQPPIHHWTTYNTIAKIEACSVLLPSERQGVSFIVEFENDPS